MSGGSGWSPVIEVRLPHRVVPAEYRWAGDLLSGTRRSDGPDWPLGRRLLHRPRARAFPRPKLSTVCIHRHPNGGHYKTPRFAAMRRNWFDIFRYSAGARRCALGGAHDFYLLNQWPLMHVTVLPRPVRARSAIHWCEIRDDAFLRTLQAVLPRLVASNFCRQRGGGAGDHQTIGQTDCRAAQRDSTRSVSVGATRRAFRRSLPGQVGVTQESAAAHRRVRPRGRRRLRR